MKTMFRAILNFKGKEVAFSQSSNSIAGLKALLSNSGLSLSNVAKIETFEVVVEKQRGRAPRKH